MHAKSALGFPSKPGTNNIVRSVSVIRSANCVDNKNDGPMTSHNTQIVMYKQTMRKVPPPPPYLIHPDLPRVPAAHLPSLPPDEQP